MVLFGSFQKEGFQNKLFRINSLVINRIFLTAEPHFKNKKVYSATRKEEDWLSSPISIETLSYQDIKNSGSFNFYHAIGNLKGVDRIHSGMGALSLNTLGFGSTINNRFAQFIDGVDNQIPDLNFTLGNLTGISELDIETIEVIPLTSSAVYGPNAMNGVMNVRSKSPFEKIGLSATAKTGINQTTSFLGKFTESLYHTIIIHMLNNNLIDIYILLV